MTEWTQLVLQIDATSVDKGTKALDELTAAGWRAEGKAVDINKSFNMPMVKQASTQMHEMSNEVQRLLGKYDPLGAKLRSLESDFEKLNKAANGGEIGTHNDLAVDNAYAGINAEIARTKDLMASAGVAIDGSAMSMKGMGLNTQYARRELMILGREALTGNFSQMPQTFMSLVTHSNLLAMAMTPIGLGVIGVTAAVAAGIAVWYNWGEEAQTAAEKAKEAVANMQKYGMFMKENNLFILKTQSEALGRQIPSAWLGYNAKELESLPKSSQELIAAYKEINDKYQVMNEQTIKEEHEARVQMSVDLLNNKTRKADEEREVELKAYVLAFDQKTKLADEEREAETKAYVLAFDEKTHLAEEAHNAQITLDVFLMDRRFAEAEKFAEYQKKLNEDLNRTLTDALMRGFEAGKGFAQVFVDTVQNMFNTLILRPVVSAIISPVSGAITAGMGSMGFSGAAGAAGIASSGSYTMAQGAAYYAGGGTVSGAFAGSTSAGIGAAASAVAPYAAAAAAAYVIAKYGFGWGNGRENVGGNRLVGSFNRSGFSGGFEQSWKEDGGLFGSDETGVYKTALTTAQGRAYRAAVAGFQATFNELGSAIGDLSLYTKAWEVNVNQAGDVTTLLADGIGKQLLPQLEKFREVGETLADTATRLTGVFSSTNSFIVALGLSSQDAFGAIGIDSTEARESLTSAAGGIDAFAQKAGFFVQNFLTEAQQIQPALDSVARTFTALNIQGVYTNEQFAELVKTEVKLGHWTIVDQLLSVAGAFDTVTEASRAMLSTDTFVTMVDYIRAVARQGSAAADLISGAMTTVEPVMLQEAAVAASGAADAAVAARDTAHLGVVAAQDKLTKASLPVAGRADSDAKNIRQQNISEAQAELNIAIATELAAIAAALVALGASSEATAASSKKTADILRSVTQDGQSLQTSVAA